MCGLGHRAGAHHSKSLLMAIACSVVSPVVVVVVVPRRSLPVAQHCCKIIMRPNDACFVHFSFARIVLASRRRCRRARPFVIQCHTQNKTHTHKKNVCLCVCENDHHAPPTIMQMVMFWRDVDGSVVGVRGVVKHQRCAKIGYAKNRFSRQMRIMRACITYSFWVRGAPLRSPIPELPCTFYYFRHTRFSSHMTRNSKLLRCRCRCHVVELRFIFFFSFFLNIVCIAYLLCSRLFCLSDAAFGWVGGYAHANGIRFQMMGI